MYNDKFWKKYFSVYDYLNYLIPYQELLDSVVDELDIKNGDRILDAGCGTGNLAVKIQKNGGNPVCLDNSDIALKVYKKKNPSGEILKQSLEDNLPFADGVFDKVAMNNVLYTFPQDAQRSVLKELKRVLKPQGKIVVTNPKKGWNPVVIYKEGLKKYRKKYGVIKTIELIFKLLIPTLKIFFYNSKIIKEGTYTFLDKEETYRLFTYIGFSNVSAPKDVYSEQGILITAIK